MGNVKTLVPFSERTYGVIHGKREESGTRHEGLQGGNVIGLDNAKRDINSIG